MIGQAQIAVTFLLALGMPWAIALAANLKLFPLLAAAVVGRPARLAMRPEPRGLGRRARGPAARPRAGRDDRLPGVPSSRPGRHDRLAIALRGFAGAMGGPRPCRGAPSLSARLPGAMAGRWLLASRPLRRRASCSISFRVSRPRSANRRPMIAPTRRPPIAAIAIVAILGVFGWLVADLDRRGHPRACGDGTRTGFDLAAPLQAGRDVAAGPLALRLRP